MKRLMSAVAAFLLLATARPQRIEFSGTPLAQQNRELLERSIRRAVPPGTEVRVVLIDREVATRPAAQTP